MVLKHEPKPLLSFSPAHIVHVCVGGVPCTEIVYLPIYFIIEVLVEVIVTKVPSTWNRV